MQALELIRRLHEHRLWVNERLLTVADGLTVDQLQRAFEIGQGSIWKTLTHLYAGEYVWLETLLGDEDPLTPGDVRGKLPGNQEGADALQSVAQLRERWNHLNLRWAEYLDQLAADALTETVYKTSSLSGKRAATQRSDILLHVCTHAQYTTAQAINMMRHAGVESLPDVMLITMARQES